MKENRNGEHTKKVTKLFWVTAILSVGLMALFTASFFRELESWKMHDVSWGFVSIVLGVITLYAGTNKVVQGRCSETEKVPRPGGKITVGILLWWLLLEAMYQVRVFPNLWEMELSAPQHLHAFVGGVVVIFGGSKAYDLLPKNFIGRNNSDSQPENNTVEDEARMPNPPAV